jgi:hypothetical protein
MVHELLHIIFDMPKEKNNGSIEEYAFNLLQHQRLEFMARSLIMAKYGVSGATRSRCVVVTAQAVWFSRRTIPVQRCSRGNAAVRCRRRSLIEAERAGDMGKGKSEKVKRK